MPGMEDETFAKSVVYLCEHSERGALGIVINKPTELTLPKLFAKVDLPLERKDLQESPVFGGGPLHTERGFVLHEKQVATAVTFADMKAEPLSDTKPVAELTEKVKAAMSLEQQLMEALHEEAGQDAPESTFYASSLTISDGLEMTTSKDVLEALASGGGPRKVLVSLGHAGWAKGQLESELAENTWLHVKASPEVIFDTPVSERYTKALGLLGLQEWMISRDVGRA
ncbi:YqgE/AlgH family protein [Variovorax sp. PCZ-1]|nr:YqgE/AlgH family protein [Variovorax sp. PCZ-1]